MKTSNKKNKLDMKENFMYELFLKADRIKGLTVERAISEGSLSILLSEAIDQADIDKVKDAIKEASEWLDSVEDYFKSLKDFDRTKIPATLGYIDSLSKALGTAESELAAASFQTGAVSGFLGQKLTLPQITQAAITIQTKAYDFGMGFSDAVQNIKNNLTPLVPEEDWDTPLQDLAGAGKVPDQAKIKKGIETAMTKAFGGGVGKKIKNFFSKSLTGPEKKIMDSMPTFDPKELAEEVADALLNSPPRAFFESEGPDDPGSSDTESLGPVAQEAQEEEDKQSQGEEQTPAETPPPLKDENQASQEQDQAQQELTSAIKDEAGEAQSPGDAAFGAIDSWLGSLSKTSQDSLRAKNRIGSLKDVVKSGLDNASKAVENEVQASIQSWREENEETLLKSKRFAKKNFDSLQDLIPKLAASMLKKTNESSFKITKNSVQKVVYEFLDRKFYKKSESILLESSYTEKEMIAYRLNKLAGLE